MDLVNMKSPPPKKTEGDVCCDPSSGPAYPYGLQLRLGDDELKKLGITELPKVGATFHLIAAVEVVSVSDYDSKDGGDHSSVEYQITDMALAAPEKPSARAAKLYPSMRS